MAKKQTRRSVSLSRATYERLKAFCDLNDMSMSEFVETRIGDYLGRPRTRGSLGAPSEDAARKVAERIFTF
jgi:hypothetical protein